MKYDANSILQVERDSIRGFVQYAADEFDVFRGANVLDYGCGKQPHRGIVEAARGRYHGYDDPGFPASTVEEAVGDPHELLQRRWGAILCTQVLQYQPNPQAFVNLLGSMLRKAGALVITWPTCWREIENDDLFRFTQMGGRRLLYNAGFERITSSPRADIDLGGFRFCLGHGAIAWK